MKTGRWKPADRKSLEITSDLKKENICNMIRKILSKNIIAEDFILNGLIEYFYYSLPDEFKNNFLPFIELTNDDYRILYNYMQTSINYSPEIKYEIEELMIKTRHLIKKN